MLKTPKTLLKYFVSYFVVFCIPTIVLSVFCYSLLIDTFKDNMLELEYSEQANMLDDIEHTYQSLQHLVSVLNASPNIYLSGLPDNPRAQMELMAQLNIWLLSDKSIEDIILWIPDHELLYTSNSTYTTDTYSKVHGFDFLSHMDELVLSTTNFFTTDDQKSLYLSFPFISSANDDRIAQLIFKLKTSLFFPFEHNEYLVYFNNSILIDQMNSTVDVPDFESSAKFVENSDYTFITTDNQVTSTRVVVAFDNQVFLEQYNELLYLFIVIVIIVFIVSFLLLSFFSYRNYQPIRLLANTAKLVGFNGDNQDEISNSAHALIELSEKNRSLRNRMQTEYYNTRDLWLSRLVLNHYTNFEQIKNSLEQYDVKFINQFYAVCIINVIELPDKIDFSNNIFRAHDNSIYFYLESELRIVCIIGCEDDSITTLSEQLNNISNGFIALGIQHVMFVGDLVGTPAELTGSFIHALICENFREKEDQIINFYRERYDAFGYILFPKDEIQLLSMAIEKNDKNAVLSHIHNIIVRLNGELYKYSLVTIVAYEIAGQFLLSNSELLSPKVSSCILFYQYQLNKSYSKEMVMQALNQFEQQLSELILKSPVLSSKTADQTLEQIVDYLNKNFADSELYLGGLAELFGLSQSNLNQQLKRKLGTSPGRYITSLRIEKAEKLLTDTTKNLTTIAKEVGFSDLASLNRNFKSIVGKNPADFRKYIDNN